VLLGGVGIAEHHLDSGVSEHCVKTRYRPLLRSSRDQQWHACCATAGALLRILRPAVLYSTEYATSQFPEIDLQ
jgi:hypothetical protein